MPDSILKRTLCGRLLRPVDLWLTPRYRLGRFPLQWVVTPGEHLRFWTRADFHWWARQLGFKIVRAVPYQGTPLLKSTWPGLFAAAFVYVLRDIHKGSL